MTGEGVFSRRIGAAGRSGEAESRRRSGACPVCGAKLRNPPRFRRLPPVFFASARGDSPCSAAFAPAAPRRSKSCAFSVSAPQFFRRSPALFSFGGRVAPSAGVKCAASRVRVSRTRQPLFDFSLHRFTHPYNTLTHKQLRVNASPHFAFTLAFPRSHPVRAAPDRGVKTAAR